jgi:hydroxymethylpyrimidine/phosphomethylpyrimidine kinase
VSSQRRVLVIAASDSSGGAGLTRDIATLSELGCEARCALTAVTVQTDRELRAVYPLPPELIEAQIHSALESDDVGAIKIGMLGGRNSVAAVIASLPSRIQIPIVLDPVLAASSGGTLLDPDAQQLLREALLPRVSLLTPNIPEACALLQQESIGRDIDAVAEQALRLLRLGPEAVLLKGGHSEGEEVVDILVAHTHDPIRFTAPRIAVQRRGTGCSLASAIAANLAAGRSLVQACSGAQSYVRRRLNRPA